MGTSSAESYLSDYLKKHHSTIAARIVAIEQADLSALTEPEIEELARGHFVSIVPPRHHPVGTTNAQPQGD